MSRRKQISFDIDTRVTKVILGEQSYTKIYSDIRGIMERSGWQHIEGSVYMSNRPMSNGDVLYVLDEMKMKFPYLEKCIREIHQADISNVHSLNRYFSYDGTPGRYERAMEKTIDIHKREPPEKPSVCKQLEQNKTVVRGRSREIDSGERINTRQDRDLLR